MKFARFLLLGLLVGGPGSQAAGAAERAPDYANLEVLVGRWTTVGSESDFVETCDWYHGNRHVVCHAERKRPDGSTSHGMSILSFVPGAGYVYTGIGSNGRYETLQGGTWSEGVLTFTSTAEEGGKAVVTRIQIGPVTDEGMPFVVDTSTAGEAWTRVETTTYVKRP